MYAFTAYGTGADRTPFLIGLNATDGSSLTSMYKSPADCFGVLSMVIKNGKIYSKVSWTVANIIVFDITNKSFEWY